MSTVADPVPATQTSSGGEPPCDFCRREIPCECAGEACMCTCGRCMAPYDDEHLARILDRMSH